MTLQKIFEDVADDQEIEIISEEEDDIEDPLKEKPDEEGEQLFEIEEDEDAEPEQLTVI